MGAFGAALTSPAAAIAALGAALAAGAVQIARLGDQYTDTMNKLRAAPRDATAPCKPRESAMQELAKLRRPEGATVAQIAEATDWAKHTVCGFFAGLKKKARAAEVKTRKRMVGPNKAGAKGSFTIYALAE